LSESLHHRGRDGRVLYADPREIGNRNLTLLLASRESAGREITQLGILSRKASSGMTFSR